MKLLNKYFTLILLSFFVVGISTCDTVQTGKIGGTEEVTYDEPIFSFSKKVGGIDYPGQPAEGKIFWGSSISGNGDPARHEVPTGETLSIRRTFWHWDDISGNMIDTVTKDLNNGRLPWISVKPPASGTGRWQQVANGQHDTALDAMLQDLDAFDGPIWLTMHHEPENDDPTNFGSPADHLDMNEHVRDRMNALGTDNIALAEILMAWTFDERSGRDADDWWESGIYDIFAVDIYRDEEASVMTKGQADEGGGPIWPYIRDWADQKGVDIGVGEWGMRGDDSAAGQRVQDWYDEAANSYNDGNGARVVALSAFDSGLNSPTGSWELQGDQLTTFRQLMSDPSTASIGSLPTDDGDDYTISDVVVGDELSSYPADNAIDGDTTTRWSSWDNLSTAWARFDLGESKSVNEVKLKIYKADIRGPFPLAIKVGDNPSNLQEVWSGNSSTDTDFQTFSFTSTTGQYVRVEMTAPNAGQYNDELLSLWEAEIRGTSQTQIQHTVSSATVGEELASYPAEDAFDADTTTRWSSWDNLSTAWIRFDLGQTVTVDELKLKIYKADIRGPFPLAIKVGDSPSNLQEVWSGDSSTDTDFQTFSFSSTSGQYVEVEMTDPNAGQYNDEMLSLWEAEIYGLQ